MPWISLRIVYWPVSGVGHQSHGDAGDRRRDGHSGVHQREGAAADAGHRGGAVRAHDFGDQTHGVRKLVGVGDHREQRPLRQGAMTDVAAARSAQSPHFADAERWEVVVVDVALAALPDRWNRAAALRPLSPESRP